MGKARKEPPRSGSRGFFAFLSDALFWVFRSLVRLLLLVYFRFEASGKVPPEGPLLIACNHTSFLDSIWLGAASSRRIRFLMSDLYGGIFGLRWFFRWNKVILVPEEGGLKEFMTRSLQALEEGAALGIFPEGWITLDGSVREFQPGVIRLAMKTGARIVPAAIVGGARAFPRRSWFPRPWKVRVRIGEPLEVESLLPEQGSKAERVGVAASRLRAKVLELMEHPPD